MPIFDYSCRECSHTFETLVRAKDTPECPECGSRDLEKLLSLPAIKSEGTRRLALKAAKKRDATQAKDRMQDRIRYEESHDRHG